MDFLWYLKKMWIYESNIFVYNTINLNTPCILWNEASSWSQTVAIAMVVVYGLRGHFKPFPERIGADLKKSARDSIRLNMAHFDLWAQSALLSGFCTDMIEPFHSLTSLEYVSWHLCVGCWTHQNCLRHSPIHKNTSLNWDLLQTCNAINSFGISIN